MSSKERIRRPVPPRVRPKRNIVGALSQKDASLDPAMGSNTAPSNGSWGHPLGPAFDNPPYENFTGNGFSESGLSKHGMSDDDRTYIEENVRAASDLVDAHIRQGAETAKTLNGGATNTPFAKSDVTDILTNLVRTYSDAATACVELVSNLAQNLEGFGDKTSPKQKTPVNQMAVGFSIRCSGPTEVNLEMLRETSSFLIQPLIATDNNKAPQITDVGFEPAGSAATGKIFISVPDNQPEGTYHGLLLSSLDGAPAGVLTLRLLSSTEAEQPS